MNKNSKKSNISSSENVQQKIIEPNQVVFDNSFYSKRKASRIPLSPLNPEDICTPKRIRTPNAKYATPLSCVTDISKYSSGQSSSTKMQHLIGAENVKPSLNVNDIVLEKVSHSKRKATRIPLSPLNPGMSYKQYNKNP
ncbi:hypothetical protein P8452_71173 [Trifolium repens]|nr:hypothetical protein P8452_71173 [Trifolium repens]